MLPHACTPSPSYYTCILRIVGWVPQHKHDGHTPLGVAAPVVDIAVLLVAIAHPLPAQPVLVNRHDADDDAYVITVELAWCWAELQELAALDQPCVWLRLGTWGT